jgi:hypothetical protein
MLSRSWTGIVKIADQICFGYLYYMDVRDFSSHLFWSYDRTADIEPEVVIKQVITYGEVSDKILLSKRLGTDRIMDVILNWTEREKHDKHINFMLKVILA